jgi:hypothetical protein
MLRIYPGGFQDPMTNSEALMILVLFNTKLSNKTVILRSNDLTKINDDSKYLKAKISEAKDCLLINL